MITWERILTSSVTSEGECRRRRVLLLPMNPEVRHTHSGTMKDTRVRQDSNGLTPAHCKSKGSHSHAGKQGLVFSVRYYHSGNEYHDFFMTHYFPGPGRGLILIAMQNS